MRAAPCILSALASCGALVCTFFARETSTAIACMALSAFWGVVAYCWWNRISWAGNLSLIGLVLADIVGVMLAQ
jgi:hypothetical protein